MTLPGVGVYVTHPLASAAVVDAACGTRVSAKAKDVLTRDKFGHIGTGTCSFVPLSHERMAEPAPLPLRFSMRLRTWRPRLEPSLRKSSYGVRDLSTTVYRGATRQVLALATLQASHDGWLVLP